MELDMLNIGLMIGGLVLANFSAKLGMAMPLLKKVMSYAEEYKNSKSDGHLTEHEKAVLYDKMCATFKEAWEFISGWLPIKGI